MADEIDLGSIDTGNKDWLPPEPEKTGIGDYGRAAVAGGYSLIGSLGAGVDYLTDAEPDGGAHRLRKWADQGQRAMIEGMAPEAKDALNAGFLPGGQNKSIWDDDVSMVDSLGLKLANATPSVLSSIIPGGIVGRAARAYMSEAGAAGAGMAAAGGINALSMGGQVFGDIQEGILNAKEEELKRGSPLYSYLRDQGFTDEIARRVLVDAAAGNKPALMGMVGAAAEHFGAGAVASKLGAGTLERGVLRGIRRGATEEAATETGQSVLQEGLTQAGQIEGGQRQGYDVRAMVEQGVQGGVLGGIMGGAIGGAGGALSGREQTPKQPGQQDTDPVVEGAAQPTEIGTPRERARRSLNDLDAALDTAGAAVEQAKDPGVSRPGVAEESVIAQATPPKAEPEVVARAPTAPEATTNVTSDFVPQNEFEADPDAELPVTNGEPPVPPGHVRMYHGGSMPGEGETRWTNPDPEYARKYRAGDRDNDVFYVDVPEDHPALQRAIPEEDLPYVNQPQRYLNSELPPDIAAGMRPLPRQDAPPVADVEPGQANEGSELAQVPPTGEASPEPATAPQTASEEIDLGAIDTAKPSVPEPQPEVTTPAQEQLAGKPRVLASQTKPKAETPAPQSTGRMSQAEADRIAAGEGDAVTLSHNPEDWKKQGDRRAVGRLVEAFEKRSKQDGTPMPDWAQEMVAVRGKTAGNNPTAKANQARYAAARQMLSDQTLEKQNAGVARRETKDEARDRQLREKRVSDAQSMARVLDDTPLSDKASKGSLNAIKEHAAAVVAAAKRLGVEAPVGTTDPYLIYLREAGEVAAGKVSRAQAMEFVANDFFIRNNSGQELVERRRSQAQKVEQSYDEIQSTRPDEREGTDASEAYENVGASPEVASVQEENDFEVPSQREDDVPVRDTPVAPPVRETVVSDDDGRAAVAGADKAGTFKVEARKNRSVARRATPPAKAPTPAQKEAGNYKKQHIKVAGLDVSIENRAGDTRSGTDSDGKPWSVEMPAHYGYVKGTEGADGDHVDVYVKKGVPVGSSRAEGTVYVVDQVDAKTGKFDEHKAMIGFTDEADARRTYEKGFSDGKGADRIGAVRAMSSEEFKDWLKNGDTKKPAADAVTSDAMSAKSPRRPIWEREAAPAAREAADLEAFFNDKPDLEPLKGSGTTIYSTDGGTQVPSVATQNLGVILKNTDHRTAGGTTNLIGPVIANRLAKTIGDVPVHFVTKADLAKLSASWISREVLGYYDPKYNHIVLSADFVHTHGDAAVSHLAIHEGMHAAVMRTLNENEGARALVEDAMRQVREYAGDAASKHYGMTNTHEFISELFSSRSFQDFLATIPAKDNYRQLKSSTIWGLMISAVRKWLGLEKATDTMLDASLRVGAAIVDVAPNVGYYGPSTPRARADTQPQAITADAVREGLDGVKDTGRAGAGILKRTTVRASTLDQLRQSFKHLFPDGNGGSHFDRVVRNIQRMQPFVAAERESGQKFAEEFTKLLRSNPKVAEASAQLRNDVTMANLNLLPGTPTLAQMQAANKHVYGDNPQASDRSTAWQAKAAHKELQDRFSALPEAVQRQMLKEAAYYRDMQNRISSKLVQNIIDFYAPDMKKAEREDLSRKTLAGRLEEDDKKAINNDVFFNALKGAKELKSIQGMYFPLMRHGDHVVRTSDTVGDTMGGTEVRPGVVEFRGDDKNARRASRKYAEATDLQVTRVVKRYYDNTTGEPIKAVDADANSVVAYEVHVQTEGFHAFDTQSQAERFRRKAIEAGTYAKISDVQVKQGRELKGDITGSQLSALMSSVRQMTHLPETTRKMMETAIAQAAVRQMSGNRIQKKSLPRRKIEGASNEYARNALQYATSASSYLGKLEYMPSIRASLAAMDEQVRGPNRFADKGNERALLLDELRMRVDQNEDGIREPSRVMRDLMAVTMLSKLFSPAHSIINAMQPAMVSYPVLAGEHGSTVTVMELTKAYKDSGAFQTFGSGIANTARAVKQWNNVALDTSDVLAAMRRRFNKTSDGAGIGRMFDELVSRGALDDKAQFEMAASIAAGRGAAGTALAKMDRIFRQAPSAVEAVNRGTTAVAAFRLAKRKGMSEVNAIDYAFDTVMKTQGDYSPANASPYFNNPIARPFLQFKKYGQMMTHLYMDMIYRSFKGASKADRQVALKQFGQLVAVQTLMAGALSIPGLELVKYGFMLSALLGIGGGWEDQERKIKRLADNAVGEDWSNMLRKGIVSRAVGIDLSSRASLADLWTFGEPEKYTGSGTMAWIAEQYFGASGGTLKGYVDGVKAVHDGDYLKAAEKWFPVKAGADIAKAVGQYNKGDINLPGAIVKSVGLRTGQEANYQERRSIRFSEQRDAKEKQNSLRKRYLDAGTAGARLKVRSEIIAYNRTAGQRYKLSIPSMDRMREMDRKERAR